MSFPDSAEYWHDLKRAIQDRNLRPVFVHYRGNDCGHTHREETSRWKNVSCPACLKSAPTDHLAWRVSSMAPGKLEITQEHVSTYSESQVEALRIVFNAINEGKRVVVVAGAAGTGKTTIMDAVGKAVRAAHRQVLQMTPTGKAAVRLQEKTGHLTQTIHAALYGSVEEDPETGKPVWKDPGIDAKPGDVLIIDEFSMVGEKLFTDLETTCPRGVTIVCVGDHCQLSPVQDTFTMYTRGWDVELKEVHRQAMDNPILALATAARTGKHVAWLRNYKHDDARLTTGHGKQSLLGEAAARILAGEDSIILCYTNPCKQELNTEIRKMLDRRKMFEVGDRIIIRTNNHSIGLMNGQIFTVESARIYTDKIWGKYALVHFVEKKTPVRISLRHFGCERGTWWDYIKNKPNNFPKNYVHADYGYAITTHSSQGSEWNHVFYWWEQAYSNLCGRDQEEAQRLIYTAITRAAETLVIHR